MLKYKNIFITNDEQFDTNIESIKKWIIESKLCKLPTPESNDEFEKTLGRWCSNVRLAYKNNKLSSNRIKLCETIPYWYWNQDDYCNRMFIHLQTYIKENQKFPGAKSKNIWENKLGNFITAKKKDYFDNKLDKKYIKILENIPNWSWKRNLNDDWKMNLEKLEKYIVKFKKYPTAKDDKFINKWMEHQKTNYKNKSAIMKNDTIRQQWEEFITEYQEYFPNNPAIQEQEKKPTKKSTSIRPKTESKETAEQKAKRIQSEYQEITKKMSIQKSDTTKIMFEESQELWYKYHDNRDFSFNGYDKQDEIPVNKIISYLETKKNHKLKILDLGCGRNLIYQHFKDNKKVNITGYDYVSFNNSKEADISDLPEDDESTKICIYSQSLMGSNWKEYLNEGKRVLEYNGEMIISESVERYQTIKDYLININMHIIKEEYKNTNRWFYLYVIKQ